MADQRLKPVLLVKPGTVSRKDIARAEKLGFICIVECADPESARFLQPPIAADIDDQARSAIELMRYLVFECNTQQVYRLDLVRIFVKALMSGNRPTNAQLVAPVAKKAAV